MRPLVSAAAVFFYGNLQFLRNRLTPIVRSTESRLAVTSPSSSKRICEAHRYVSEQAMQRGLRRFMAIHYQPNDNFGTLGIERNHGVIGFLN